MCCHISRLFTHQLIIKMDGATLGDELLQVISEFPAEIISVFGTLLCVILFYFYLQRLDIQLLGDTSHQDDLEPVPETKVVTSTLPFTVKFTDEPSVLSSLKDGVQIEVQTRIDCYLQGFWIVDCVSFSETLNSNTRLSGREFILNLEGKLQEISHFSTEQNFLNADTSQSIHLKISDRFIQDIASPGNGTDFDLGPTPRSKYPLVILMSVRGEDSESENWSHDVSIHTMLWVVHLPDSTVTKPLHIISQMLITSQGLICDVQKMFMAADETNIYDEADNFPELQTPGSDDGNGASLENRFPLASHDGDSPSNGGPDFRKSCTVCQNAPITRVIIPCRHACVCEICLRVLNACPMCRGVISSHFRLDSAGSAEDNDDESPSYRENDWKTRLWNMNETLNAWFGFR